jgi:hypothetical protein
MKLGLGLDVRKASAPAFKGLLDKFTGAVAAYSTRKLTASQPNILPADYGDGAAAAYSLRKVKASYSGNCIDVRRSSDDTTSSIGFSGNELDTTALEAFVNEDVDTYTSDFSSTDNLGESNGTGAAAQSIGGVDDAYKFTCDSTISFHSATTLSIFEVGQVYNVSFKYYIPSGQTIDGIRFIDWGISNQSTLDEWVTVNETNLTSTRNNIRFFAGDGTSITPSTNVDGNVFYLKDLIITQTTADGFVTKWYDQSGNENDATQSTDNDQPQIVDAGSTILENGKPAIQFDGVDDYLAKIATFTINGDHMISAVHTPEGVGGYLFSMGYNDSESILLWNNATNYSRYWLSGSGDQLNSAETVAGQRLTTGEFVSGTQTLYIDGTQNSTKSTTYSGGDVPDITIGYAVQRAQGSNYLIGKVQELIFFNSDQSDNRQDIEWNINNHYNIYTDSWDKQSAMEVRRAIDNETTNIGFAGKDLDTTALETFATESSPVLDDYTGAAAAYSLRKVRSAYTGSAVRVRRSSDDGLQDIGFDANGDLDTTALLAFVGGQNLLVQSNQFDTTWSKTADVTGGQSGYDGSSDAWLLEANSVNQYERVSQSVTTTGYNTFSIYAKADTADFLLIYNNNFSRRVWFNLSTGSVGSSSLIISATMEDVGSGWYRCSVVMDLSSSSQYWVCVANTDNDVNATTGDSIYIQHAQLEEGSTATTYKPTATGIGGDGAVTTWYDQSGNGNDATKITESEQPLIVDGGTLVEENSKAAVDFDGVDDYLTASNLLTELDNTDFLISAVSADEFSAGSEASVPRLYLRHRAWSYNTLDTMTWSPLTGQSLLSFQVDGATQEVFGNGTSLATASEAQVDFTPTDFQVGRYASTGWMDGTLQEIIIFNSDQSANRTGIEGNIGRYYNIDGFRDVFVTKWFDQSGNFNHAENSTSTEQPQIVDGGSVITEGTTPKPAIDFDGVDDLLDIGQSIDLYSLASEWSIFMDAKIQDYTLQSFQRVLQNDSSLSSSDIPLGIQFRDTGDVYFFNNGSVDSTTITSATQRNLVSFIKRSSDTIYAINGTSATGTKGSVDFTAGLEDTTIGNSPNGTTRPAKLKTAELIIFDSDQSSNRTDIENNINKHFKIYE